MNTHGAQTAGRTAIGASVLSRATQWPLRRRRYRRAVVAADTIATGLAAVTALAMFDRSGPHTAPMAAAGLVWIGWIATLWFGHGYELRNIGYGAEEYRLVARAGVRTTISVALIDYVGHFNVGPAFCAVAFLVGFATLFTVRAAFRSRLRRARARGAGWAFRMLVVGDAAHVLELIRQLRREPYAGYRVIGVCVPEALLDPPLLDTGPQHLGDVPVVGSFRNIVEAATAAQADTIAVTGSAELTASRLRRLGWQLEGTGIELAVAPALTDVAGPRIHTRPVAGLPLIHVEAASFSSGSRLIKGVMDRVIATSILFALLPVLLLIAVLIKLGSKGPVLFRQRRVGQHGREFSVYKFRTMHVGADEMLLNLQKLHESEGLIFKMRADPRVTRIGRFLRRFSLDELPQFVNVLRGDMSLVGPRPPLPSEVAQYDGDIARRLLVKPGITGLWQVSGRSDLSWEDGIRLDLFYVENWSLTSDITILWKTLGALIRSRGAY